MDLGRQRSRECDLTLLDGHALAARTDRADVAANMLHGVIELGYMRSPSILELYRSQGYPTSAMTTTVSPLDIADELARHAQYREQRSCNATMVVERPHLRCSGVVVRDCRLQRIPPLHTRQNRLPRSRTEWEARETCADTSAPIRSAPQRHGVVQPLSPHDPICHSRTWPIEFRDSQPRLI